jgi:hypothetical protein
MVNIVHKKPDGSLDFIFFVDGQIHPKFNQQDFVDKFYENQQITEDYKIAKIDIALPISRFIFQSTISVLSIQMQTPLIDGEVDPAFDIAAVAKDMKEGENPQVPENHMLVGFHVDKEKSIVLWQKPLQSKVFEIETPLYTAEYHRNELIDMGAIGKDWVLIGYDPVLPDDHRFRDAWVWNEAAQAIEIDINKAKTITKAMLNEKKAHDLKQCRSDLLVAIGLEDEEMRKTASNAYKAIDAVDIEAMVEQLNTFEELVALLGA